MRNKDTILLESLYDKVIEEAKKKINPWAIANAKEPNASKKVKEKMVKGIKKSAKKYGEEITSEKVKSKKK
jgi:hypothetical protein